MVDWSDKIKLPIEWVYYPPYHSKYNPVEHCWGVLERHWNGALLTDIEAVREWTKSMRWDGMGWHCSECVFFGQRISSGSRINHKRNESVFNEADTNALDRAVEPGDPTRKTDIILSGESPEPKSTHRFW